MEEYDEKASADEFREALLAWRSGGANHDVVPPTKKRMTTTTTTSHTSEDAGHSTPDHGKAFEQGAKDAGRYFYFGVLMKQYAQK